MQSLILPYLTAWTPFGYLIIFIGMMLEGDVTLFSAAFLTQQGFFRLGTMVLVVWAALLAGDIVWFFAGRLFQRRWPRIGSLIGKVTGRFDQNILEQTGRTIFLSKFVYGYHHILLSRAGAIGLDFNKFIKKDIAASFLWMLIVGGLGFFSGASLFLAKGYLRYTERALLVGLIGFLILEFLVGYISKRRMSR